MRVRSLLAVVLVALALPVAAQPVSPDTLTAIADLEVDCAFDVFATPRTKVELLASAHGRYRQALQAEPKHKDALLGLARLHTRVGERKKAIEAYKLYLDHYPNDGDAKRELAKLETVRIHDRFGALSGAVGAEPEWREPPEPLPFAPGVRVRGLGSVIRAEPAFVTISTTVVKVPRAFITRSGLDAGGAPDAKSWTLSPRETRMLMAMIQRDPDRKFVTEPQVCTQDGRMACIRTGGQILLLASDASGPRVHYAPTVMNLELTPKVSADGNSVVLTIDYSSPAAGVAAMNTVGGNVFNPLFQQYADNSATYIQALRAKETLRFNESYVAVAGYTTVATNSFCDVMRRLCDSEPFVTLLIVTPAKGVPDEAVFPGRVWGSK